ncbi:hypothetical protein KCU62_g5358, partial [Aureobasidium sp. EXF-3399]
MNRIIEPSSRARQRIWTEGSAKFFITLAFTATVVQLLFLADISYLNGALYHEAQRIHNLKFLMVDHDQGAIGQSLRSAANALQSDIFPSVEEYSTSDYPKPSDIRRAVLVGDFWAAIYSHSGASSRLDTALRSNDTTVHYDPTNALTYIYNGARYASIEQGYIDPNLQALVLEADAMYQEHNGMQNLKFVEGNANAVYALLHPIASTALNIKETDQGARNIYNTVGMVYTVLMQFFFVLALNILCGRNKLFGRQSFVWNYLFRASITFVYSFIGAICASGLIFAFMDDWTLSASQ